jgi:hypothetical protein
MQRMRMVVGSGMLVALFACTGGSSSTAETSTSITAPTSRSTSAPVTTVLEGTWRSVLDARALDGRGFSAKQIHTLQAQDEWSSRQVNEIRIDGDTWVLLQGVDGETPTAHADFGQISVAPERIRLDEGVCFLVLTYRLNGDEIQMTLVRSTCDQDPTEPIPDFMYSAVFGQPYSRQA